MTQPESFFWASFLKPFIALVLFVFAAVLGRVILSLIPEGRIKRLLQKPVGGSLPNSRRGA